MKNFINQAERMIRDHIFKVYPEISVSGYGVYTVWSCKTAGNCKAMLSTTLPDGKYYEVTYIGDEHKIVLDCYKRVDKIVDNFEVIFEGAEAERRDREEGRK